jgi:hypothetical protein
MLTAKEGIVCQGVRPVKYTQRLPCYLQLCKFEKELFLAR